MMGMAQKVLRCEDRDKWREKVEVTHYIIIIIIIIIIITGSLQLTFSLFYPQNFSTETL